MAPQFLPHQLSEGPYKGVRVEPYVIRRMEMTVLIKAQECVEVLSLSVFHKDLEFVLYR